MGHIRGSQLLPLLLLGVGLGAQAPAGVPATGTADSAAAARAALEHSGCQLELPVAVGGAHDGGGHGPRGGADRVRTQPPSQPSPSMAVGGFSVAEPVLWLVLGFAIAGLVVVIVRNLTGRAELPRRPAVPHLAADPDAPRAVIEPVPDYDQLAASGHFPAAVNALLRHALAALVERGGALPPHTTGRQAVRRARERALPVDDLAALVRTNERVHFGGAAADDELFFVSRQQFERWRQACRAEP